MGTDAALAPLAATVADWTGVVECASRNNVIPLVASALRDEPAVPLPIRRDLDKRYMARAGQNGLLARELRDIVSALNEAGIAVVAYKGPALATLAYGGLMLRNPSADLDLLLDPGDIQRAKEVVAAKGYSLTLTEEDEQHFLKYRYHLHFERANPELHLELHWALTPAYWPFPMNWRNRTQSVALAGSSITTLDPEATLL